MLQAKAQTQQSPALAQNQKAASNESSIDKKELLAIEDRKMDLLEKALDSLANNETAIDKVPSNFTSLLSGNSERAWKIRAEILDRMKSSADPESAIANAAELISSLKGVPGEKAVKFFNQVKAAGFKVPDLIPLEVIRGDNSPAAWTIRNQALKAGMTEAFEALESLQGLSGEQATKLRSAVMQKFYALPLTTKDDSKDSGSQSESQTSLYDLAKNALESGIEALPEKEKSQVLENFKRNTQKIVAAKLKDEPDPRSEVEKIREEAFEYTGKDSPEAWSYRKNAMEKFSSDKELLAEIARSLANVDNEQATAMRKKLIASGIGKGALLESYTGVDSEEAWKLRQESYESLKREGRIYGQNGADLFEKLTEAQKQQVITRVIDDLSPKYGDVSNKTNLEAVEKIPSFNTDYHRALLEESVKEIGGVVPPKKKATIDFDQMSEAESKKAIEEMTIADREIISINTVGESLRGVNSKRGSDFIHKMADEYVSSGALLNAVSSDWSKEAHAIRMFIADKIAPSGFLRDLSGFTGNSKLTGEE